MGCSDQPGMISLEDCRSRVLDGLAPVCEAQPVELEQACGRVLAEDILARLDMPPADNSAMDGYALPPEDAPSFAVIGESLAGHPFSADVGPGQCVRIMTGAHLPAGCNRVVMQEDVRREDNRITLQRACAAGSNVRPRGEDILAGAPLLAGGRTLRPADIGLLASQGVTRVPARRRLKVALLSTGDELVAPGQALAPGQIYDSNRHALRAMLQRAGFDVLDMGLVRDDLDAIEQTLAMADQQADVVLSSAGVSVGEADHVRTALGRLGEILVWRIAIKPGKPFAFGRLPSSLFFGLPGNPVSALVTLQQLAMPALAALQGADWVHPARFRARAGAPMRKRPGRTDFQRGVLQVSETGELAVAPLAGQGSGLVTSMSRADCFIVLERERGDVEAGESVWVEPFTPPL